MKRLLAIALSLPLPSFIALSALAQSPATPANSALSNAEAVHVSSIKELRKGAGEWPLIANADNSAEQRVNATLTRMNLRLPRAIEDCDQSYLASLKQMGSQTHHQNPVSKDWSRTIKVTMAGPRFLSLVATDETFCGGAHPVNDQIAMVFDLTTGAPVNWVALLPTSTGASAYSDTATDGTTMGALILPALQAASLAAADADCKDAFQDPQPFLIWPDAKRGILVAQSFDLPHVVQACANEVDLTVDLARKMGFSESLLGAIIQAHRPFAVKPKQ